MLRNKTWPSAAVVAGLVALAALIGCGREQSVASKSAAAFKEAQKEGKTFAGAEHAHGHGALTPGGEHEGHEMPDEAPGESVAGHQHGTAHQGREVPEGRSAADHSAMGHGGQHAQGHAPGHGTEQHADQGHAGHSMSGGGTPSALMREVPGLPTQPASILRPDALDAPAATSVVDAQRSAEMNQAMSGGTGGHEGHGGHEAGTYRHVDAGRGAEAYEGSEPQPPGAGPQHHDHGPAEPEASLYVCPMHPEVTSKTPGICPKCGMTLVKRRKE